MMFLLTYLKQEGTRHPEESELSDPTHVNHIFPLCCLKPWPVGRFLLLLVLFLP